ncbi:radical SAM protein [bacterium]|nr:radical SAM protein [bacterium]
MSYVTNTFDRIHVELTDKCNAQCPGCVRSHAGGKLNPIIKNQQLGLDFFKNSLGIDFCSNVKHWDFCGTKGDAVSNSELLDILKFLLDCNENVTIKLHTNGGLRNTKWFTQLGNLFNNRNCVCVFALDGLEDTNHIYRKNVKWKKLWGNIIAYNKTGANTRANFLKFKHNEHQVQEIEQLCKRYKIRLKIKSPYGFKENNNTIETMPVHNPDGTFAYSIFPNTEYVKGRKVKDPKIIDTNFYIQGKYDKTQFLQELENISDVNCKISEGTTANLYIDSDGALLPCCWIASALNMGDRQMTSLIGKREDLIPSESNSIQNILESTYLSKTLKKGIKGKLNTKEKYCITCVKACEISTGFARR